MDVDSEPLPLDQAVVDSSRLNPCAVVQRSGGNRQAGGLAGISPWRTGNVRPVHRRQLGCVAGRTMDQGHSVEHVRDLVFFLMVGVRFLCLLSFGPLEPKRFAELPSKKLPKKYGD